MVGQKVKSLPAMQEARVRSLGQKDPLEEGMATHSSILGWRIPWTEEPGRLQFTGSQRVGHDFHFFFLKPLSNIVEKLLYTYINNTYYTYILENL